MSQQMSMEWKKFPSSSVAREDAAMTYVEQENGDPIGVIVVGGRSLTESSLSHAEVLEYNSKKWWNLPPLQNSRCGCAITSIHNQVYVLGGLGGGGGEERFLASVESFVFGRDKQFSQNETSPMTCPRWYAAAVGLPLHGDIVVMGGRDDTWQELDLVESYDTTTKEWLPLSPMKHKRFGCGATLVQENTIFVAGGYNGKEWLTSCEILDYETNTWTTVPSPMPGALEFCVVSKLSSDYVLVTGKLSSTTSLSEMDDNLHNNASSSSSSSSSPIFCYSLSQNKWTTLQAGYPLGGCVMTCLGSRILTVDGSRRARISGNVLRLLRDDLTETTSRASSHDYSSVAANSFQQQQSNNTPLSEDQEAVVPWWASPELSSQAKVVIDATALENMKDLDLSNNNNDNGNEEVEWDVMSSALSKASEKSRGSRKSKTSRISGRSKNSSNGHSRSSGKSGGGGGGGGGRPRSERSTRTKRRMVENLEIVDEFGRKAKYTGTVDEQHNQPHGNGSMTWLEGGADVYEGGFRYGKMDGVGEMKYANGDTYLGEFQNNQRHGNGVFRRDKDGRTYEGNYQHDLQHDSNGTMSWKDGTVYIGAFMNGKRTGKGVQRFKSGVRYQGNFLDGKYDGFGICEFDDGKMYKGEWSKGRAHGQGRLVDANNNVLHDGKWVKDAPVT